MYQIVIISPSLPPQSRDSVLEQFLRQAEKAVRHILEREVEMCGAGNYGA